MVVDVGDVRLSVAVHGDSEPLLFLHGFMGCGSDWRYIFNDAPPAGYQLIAPDLRGHGASTNPSDTYSHRQCALDVAAVLDRLGVDRVKAIGISGGGITLLHLATTQPSRIESMVIVSAPPYFPAQARAIQRVFSESMLSAREVQLLRQRHVDGEEQIQRLFAHGRRFADSYDDVNFTPAYLSTIAAPALIVFGDRDPLYPVSMAFELRESIPRSYLWVVPNGGHSPVFGAAAPAFSAVAMDFLSGAWHVRQT
jgi:pimeloyl-ACP methyl ester carboxylesterase